MATDIKNLVAAINPDVYCDPSVISEVKKLREKDLIAAAKVAKLKSTDFIDVGQTQNTVGAFKLAGLKAPVEQHGLAYDDSAQNLEAVYFWILDYVNREFGSADKLIDNFVASPGSGQFAEMSRRATVLQDEGMKIFGTVNTVLRSILNIIYDLKEFKIRLSQYDDYRTSPDEGVRRAALLSLKQIWMDRVDITRGNGSINMLAQQLDFVTIRDAFMAVNSVKEVDQLDLNDRVKRILMQRVPEFFKWIDESERELRKRFEIEKIYLKSQVNSVKLYSRWVKPYLKAARQLEQNMGETAHLVNIFNTSTSELVLLGKGKYDPEGDIGKDDLPKFFKTLIEKKMIRKYTPLTLVEFFYRTIPDRNDQRGGYAYRGRVEITFTSFVLNEDELTVLKREVERDDFGEVYEAIMGSTDKSLGEINADIGDLLGEKEEKKEKEESKSSESPWKSLFSLFKDEEKKDDKNLKKSGLPKKDNEYEKVVRSQALLGARFSCRKLYNDYKKSLGMSSFAPSAW